VIQHARDLFEILLVSLALGMDAFSLAVSLGLQGLEKNKAYRLCLLIGLFHVAMALAGLFVGHAMEGILGQVAQWFGAFLLVGLGIHMLYVNVFGNRSDKHSTVGTTLLSMFAFAAGVSIDALSVGFSLGLRSTAYGVVSAFSFGFIGAIMCLLGIFVGKRVSGSVGRVGEFIGSLILIGYGLHFLIP